MMAKTSAELLADGNGHYLRGSLEAARECYSECLRMGEYPVACDCAVNLGSVELDLSNDQFRAEILYRLAIDSVKRGSWALDDETFDERTVLSEELTHVDGAHNLASLLQSQAYQATDANERRSLLFQAAKLYKSVVTSEPSRWDAWANLGSAMLDSNAPYLDCARCLQRGIVGAETLEKRLEASEDRQGLATVRSALATAYYGFGDALSKLLDDSVHENMLLAAVQDDDLILLQRLKENSPSLDDSSSSSFSTDRVEEARSVIIESAANAFRTAIYLQPEATTDSNLKAKAAHALDALSGDTETTRASATFVKALFDDFASTFDDQLVDGLEYRVPKLIGERLDKTYEAVLDAGCGTGLFGVELRKKNKDAKLLGIDLSENMCQVAREKTLEGDDEKLVYDAVLVGDLCDDAIFEAARKKNIKGHFDLVAAADVFCYLGDLEPVLSRFFNALKTNGETIFTVETLVDARQDQSWKLQRNGRYAHDPAYVEHLATSLGFRCDAMDDVVARLEQGIPVASTLFRLTKTNDDKGP